MNVTHLIQCYYEYVIRAVVGHSDIDLGSSIQGGVPICTGPSAISADVVGKTQLLVYLKRHLSAAPLHCSNSDSCFYL